MTVFDVAAIRLQNQQLANPELKSIKSLVSYFGAIQAQDYPMSKWAVGCRLPGATDAQLEQAIDSGEIIRTHVLRPTWHLTAAEDIRWMLALTGQNILRQFNSISVKTGLDAKTLSKSTDLIVKALEGGQHLTRDEIVEILNYNGIRTNEYRSIHILAHAELHAVICSGARKGKHHSYALMDERVAKGKDFNKEAALFELANRYFTSHGPATLRDFIWWSGLSVSDSKKAIALNDKKLDATEFNGQVYYWKQRDITPTKNQLLLLPAFDEYLISYKDRTPSIDEKHMPHAFTKNGIFKPIIVLDGQVVGIWKRTVKADKVIIEPTFLQKVPKSVDKLLVKEAKRYGDFLDKKVEMP
jgi:hypothetical protein